LAGKIAVLGSTVIEIKGYTEDEFNPKKDNLGKIEISYGGPGKKIAENLGNLKLSPNYISTNESNNFGSDLRVKLEESGVDTTYLLPVKSGGVGKSISFKSNLGEISHSLKEPRDNSHLEKYLEKYGEKFSREFDVLILELELGEEISRKAINFFKKSKKRIFIYSIDLLNKCSEYSIFEDVECILLSEKSATILLDCDVASMEIHQIQKSFKEFIKNNSARRGIIVLHQRGTVFYDNVLNQSNFLETNNEGDSTLVIDNELLFSSVVAKLLKEEDLRDAIIF